MNYWFRKVNWIYIHFEFCCVLFCVFACLVGLDFNLVIVSLEYSANVLQILKCLLRLSVLKNLLPHFEHLFLSCLFCGKWKFLSFVNLLCHHCKFEAWLKVLWHLYIWWSNFKNFSPRLLANTIFKWFCMSVNICLLGHPHSINPVENQSIGLKCEFRFWLRFLK